MSPEQAAAPFAPADVIGTPEEIEARLNDEGDALDEISDGRMREMATSAHCQRWGDYLEAWHAAADRESRDTP